MSDSWFNDLLDVAARTDKGYGDTRAHEQAIQSLAAHEGALEFMGGILVEPDKELWPSAAHVLATIGYPSNKRAIPLLIGHAADPNSTASLDALAALKSLQQSDLLAELVEVAWSARERSYGWSYSLRGVCAVTLAIGNALCDRLAPTLVFLLSQQDLREPLWMS